MRHYLRGWIALGLAGLVAWPVATLAGGKEQGGGGASLVIGVTGLGTGGKLTTTIDGLNKGQTLSVGVAPPEGDSQKDVITLSPGQNRLDFPRAVKPVPEKESKKAKAPKHSKKPKTPAPATEPEIQAARAPVVTPKERPPAPASAPEPPMPRASPEPMPLAPEPAPAQVAAPEPPAQAMAAPASAPAIRPGDGEGFRDCPECPSMIMVPAGDFVLGGGDPIEDAHKRPVTIAKPFAAGRFEVTYAEWSACVKEEACPSHVTVPTDGAQAPVAGVNHGDAKRYVQWLAAKTGKSYRLPSEAEWEYLARAGTTTTFWWGNEAGKGKANCFGCGSLWDGKRAAPVGSFAANAFGLFDTAGNVWEWVEDCYEPDAYKTHQGYPAPVAGSGFCDRVLRGGGWDIGPTGIRPTFRFGADPQNRFKFYGFRVVRE